MHIDAIGAFLIVIANVVFWSLIFLGKSFTSLARSYFGWAFFITLWAFGYGITLSGLLPYEPTLVWNKYCQAMATMIGPFFFKFSCDVAGRFQENKKIFKFYFYFGIINALALFFTPYYVIGLWSFGSYTYQPLGGPLYIIFTSFFMWCTLHSYIVVALQYKNAVGIRKTHMTLFLIATGIAYFGGGTLFFQGFRLPVPTTGVYLILAYVLIIGYSIHRYKFMDIQALIRKTLVFAGLFIMSIGVVNVITAIMQSFVGKVLSVSPFWSMMISGFGIIVLYDSTHKWLVRITNRFLFQRGYSYSKISDEVADSAQITDLNELSKHIVEIFASEMALESAALLLFDKEKNIFKVAYRLGSNDQSASFKADEDFSHMILTSKNLVFWHEDQETAKSSFVLDGWKPEVIIKVASGEQPLALLCLGRKKSDKNFSNEDLNFFESIAKQIANVINVAKKFYLERDFYALQAQRNRIELVAQLSLGIDHEIKNPLGQIIPRLDLILNYYKRKKIQPEYDRLIEFLESAIKNGQRIVNIMDRLRKFAQPVNSKNMNIHPVLVRPFIEEAIGLISEKQLELDNIHIENLVPNDICIFAEETSVVQVFHNIITNAYHAIDRNGNITIALKENVQDGRVIVTIKDTGPGIKPEIIEKIFDPFFTTKPTNIPQDGTGPRFKGTGLGLGFVKKYMEDLGGSINVSSEIGKGTIFFLKFLKSERPE